jgi:hypothetical protein
MTLEAFVRKYWPNMEIIADRSRNRIRRVSVIQAGMRDGNTHKQDDNDKEVLQFNYSFEKPGGQRS